MIGTLFSLLIALFLYFNPLPEDSAAGLVYLAPVLIIVAILIFAAQISITLFSWIPLQKSEQNLTPRIFSSYRNDRHLKTSNFLILAFLLFTFLAVVDLLFLHFFDQTALVAAWTILLGIVVDLLLHALNRINRYMDPFEATAILSSHAQQCVQDENEGELLEWIDSLAETSLKGLQRNSPSLSIHAMDHIRTNTKNFLDAAKSIGHHIDEGDGKREDTISFTLFYIFQRLELVFLKANEKKLETVLNHVISIFGKTAVDCAKFDMTLAGYPLHYMGKLARIAQDHEMADVGDRTTLTYLEVGKTILDEVEIQYVELKEPFMTIITYMKEMAKETFRQDRDINISLLIQPFEQLKKLFDREKAAAHQDKGVIVQSIDSVIEEFAALEEVLSTLPPVPDFSSEEEPSESQ